MKLTLGLIGIGHRSIPAFWTNATPANMTVAGTKATKTGGADLWDSSVYTIKSIAGDFALEYTYDDTSKLVMVFVCADPTLSNSWDTAGNWGLYHGAGATTGSYLNNGALVARTTNDASGDVFKIERVGTTLNRYHNGTLLTGSQTITTEAWHGDTSFRTVGGSISNVSFTAL